MVLRVCLLPSVRRTSQSPSARPALSVSRNCQPAADRTTVRPGLRFAGDTVRQANTGEVRELRRGMRDMKELVADLALENRLPKKA